MVESRTERAAADPTAVRDGIAVSGHPNPRRTKCWSCTITSSVQADSYRVEGHVALLLKLDEWFGANGR